MHFLKALSSAIADAIFPISPAERELFAMDPSTAFRVFPRAKNFPSLEACSVFAYRDERVTQLIWSIKYKKSRPGAAIAAYALFRMLDAYSNAADPIVVVPMPITKRRRRERGFNQCELIMDELRKLDRQDRFIFTDDLLVRTQHMSRQTLKDRSHRLESAQNIFAVNQSSATNLKASLSPSYLVADANHFPTRQIADVGTTGSTIKSAVLALHEAGFERTWGLSVAH